MTREEKARRRKKMAEAVADGTPAAEVARAYGVTTGTVYAACLENDTEVVRNNNLDRRLEIVAGLMRGERNCEIARRMRVSRQRISQIKGKAIAAGIPLPADEPEHEEDILHAVEELAMVARNMGSRAATFYPGVGIPVPVEQAQLDEPRAARRSEAAH